MDNIYYIGVRESEVSYVKNFFTDYIVIFGKAKEKGLIQPLNQLLLKNIDHNNVANDDLTADYWVEQMNICLSKHPDAKFMFYSQIKALKYFKNNKHIICTNNKKLINKLDDKLYTREYYKNKVPCLPHFILRGRQIHINKLNRLFNTSGQKYVVQSERGSGGSGTLIFYDNKQKKSIKARERYLVTQFCQNSIPINIHLMISKNNVLVLPPSTQIIENQYDHLIYKGCDFINFNSLPTEIKNKTIKYAQTIGDDLRHRGYLGVCGIDSIVCDNEVFFMEINSRFQNSSTVLNKALMENHQPSLQEMNYCCFYNKNIEYKPIEVKYSCYILDYNEETTNIPKITPLEILDESNSKLEVEKLSYRKTNLYDKSIFTQKQTQQQGH